MDWKLIRPTVRDRLADIRHTYVGNVLWRAWSDFTRDDGSIYAAAMTYYVLLSVFPLLIFLVSVFGLLVHDEDLQARVVDEIVRQLPPEANLDEQIEGVVSGVASTQANLVGLLGLVGAIWTASGMFGALRRALNNAFDVPMARSFIHGRIQDVVSVLVVLVLITLSAALTATLAIIRAYADQYFSGVLTNLGWGLVYFLVPLVISFTVFLLVFRLIPNHTLDWGDLWIGALLAAVGFEIAKAGFSFYLGYFDRFNEVYGALGGAVTFLFFVFLVSNVTIFAAEVNSELAKDHAGRGMRDEG